MIDARGLEGRGSPPSRPAVSRRMEPAAVGRVRPSGGAMASKLAGAGGSTENFRRQHQELLGLALEIGGRLTPARVAGEAAETRRLFAKFAGRLKVHARMENEA